MSEKKQPTPAEQAALDNRSRQLNSNNDAYWKSRGLSRSAPATGKKGKGS